MKKMFFVVMLNILLFASTNVFARQINYEEYRNLNVNYGFVIGDYLFDLDEGYSPSLKDIMHASRSIPKDQPTSLYMIRLFDDLNYYSFNELYSGKQWTSLDDFEPLNLNIKYVYKNYIDEASPDDIILVE